MSAATFDITPPTAPQDGPGYAVSVGLQEIIGWALDNGMDADELEERFDESVESATESRL